MPMLKLSGDYTVEVLSWYLWGQPQAPSKSEIADSKWIDRSDEITLFINPDELAAKLQDLVSLKDFKLFNTFFSGKTANGDDLSINLWRIISNVEVKNGEYYLTQQQFADLFYSGHKNHKDAEIPEKQISLYDRGILKPEFAKLAFLFGSVTATLDNEIRYVLDKDLNPLRIENAKYIVNETPDNFDFTGGTGSEEINKILRQVADPSGIGKKVILDCGDGAVINFGNLTKSEYENLKDFSDIRTKLGVENPPIYISTESDLKIAKLYSYLDEFNRIKSKGVIDYLDENGKIVMFGSNDDDPMSETKAKNFDFLDSVDIDWTPSLLAKLGINVDLAPDWLTTKLFDLNHFKDYVKNGIHYIGGDGNDTIIGTKKDDILKGGKGSDKLYGGFGYDKYYANNADTIKDDNNSKGEVHFNGIHLTGGTYDKNKDCYIGGDYEYRLNENTKTLTVKQISTQESITIKNYFKNKNSLGIILQDSDKILEKTELSDKISPNSQQTPQTSPQLQTKQNLQTNNAANPQNACHSELSKESEESQKISQNIDISQMPKRAFVISAEIFLTSSEEADIAEFAKKTAYAMSGSCLVRENPLKSYESKLFAFANVAKMDFLKNKNEQNWQIAFKNALNSYDPKSFKNALNPQLSQQNANLQNSKNNASNLQISAKNTENLQIPNPQNFSNDNKI